MQAFHVSSELGNRFAALCDGEGSFNIAARTDPKYELVSYGCRFTIGLRADDLPLLQYLRDELDLGRIFIVAANTVGNRRQPNPTARWDITAKAECLVIVRILDEFPLWSKKAADYEVWREAVLYWNAPRRYAKETRRSETTSKVVQAIDWEPMAQFHERLRELRPYRPFEEIAA